MVEYGDEDLLMLSSIQHFCFCERQWALIHIEQIWDENRLTIEGSYLHRKVDDPLYRSERNGVKTFRSLPLISRKLGLYGIADAVEFEQTITRDNAMILPDYPGYWKPFPIEYKHGKPKQNDIDRVQLCAQAMCLEEMYSIKIEQGALFYHEIRKREYILFDQKLREYVQSQSIRMHELYTSTTVPLPVYLPHCKACSLYDQCMPEFFSKKHSVKKYLSELLDITL